MKKFAVLLIALVLAVSMTGTALVAADTGKISGKVGKTVESNKDEDKKQFEDNAQKNAASTKNDTKEKTVKDKSKEAGDEEKYVYEDIFEQWEDGAPALDILIDYVEDVTDENSKNYIPEKDRIAVFDMDGTLYGELFPTYLEYYMFAWRVLCDPDHEATEEEIRVAELVRDHAYDKSYPEDMAMQHALAAASAYAGMTPDEFDQYVTEFLLKEVDGFEGMTYAEAYYEPMIEVIEYLEDNGFEYYIVSGSDRSLCRVLFEGIIDIDRDHVIGMDVDVEATGQGDTDGLDYTFSADDQLFRTDRLLVKNLKMNKVRQIFTDIGKQPVLSFGNSSGDTSMHNYTIHNNKYKSAAFMLIADDEERDYGNTEKNTELGEQWKKDGYTVISMKNDWKTIYGDKVKKTGEFRWKDELSGKKTGKSDSKKKSVSNADKAEEDLQYVMYLGTTDKNTHKPVFTETESLELARDILLKHFGGYTIQDAHGGWIGDDGKEYQEYTMVIYVSDTTEEKVHEAADELMKAFDQSLILIQANTTDTEFYKG